jgi:hypothetical protein
MTTTTINTLGPAPTVARFMLTYSDLTTAGTSQTISLKAIPKGSLILGARVLCVAAFAGGSVATATLSLGTTGGSTTGILAASNIFTGISAGVTMYVTSTLGVYAATYAADTLTATVVTTTDNVKSCTAGKAYIDVVYIPFEDLTATGPAGSTTSGGLL